MHSNTMPVTENEKNLKKSHKLNHSSSFRNQTVEILADPFSREDELRHSTGSIKGHHVISHRYRNDVSLKYQLRDERSGGFRRGERAMNGGKRSGSNDSQVSDKEEQKTPRHSVSQIIQGFESKVDVSSSFTPRFALNDENYCGYADVTDSGHGDKNKRNGSKRKLSIRKRNKNSHDVSVTVLQKLGIAPFMGSENRNAKKALSHFDVQSILFDIDNASVLKALYEEGGNRPRNISTGASAASIRGQRKKAGNENAARDGLKTRTESIIDDGDGLSNELVQSCPYFRNETGTEIKNEKQMNSVDKLLGKYHNDVSGKIWTNFGKHRTPSLELLHTADAEVDTLLGGSIKLNEIDQKNEIAVLEPVEADSKIVLWDKPRNCVEKRVFDFEHIDTGAMYYREFFIGKEHQNYLGIDEKYGPVSISMIRENIDKMAVLGHPKENSKNGTNKYQYRIILRTTDLLTYRGAVLEESIPSTTRHGSSRALPPRDIFEFCFPELQLSCLRLAIAGPKVPEQLQKLDEQQLSLQYKVGLLYCKAGQNSEEDMYNNEHHGPAFDEFMDVIGERVLLKGFEGYRAQLDNKNDSTGVYSLFSKFHNREIMFHVSTLLPWTPNNKQQSHKYRQNYHRLARAWMSKCDTLKEYVVSHPVQSAQQNQDSPQLLRKRHIGNDIVTVIFQEPGAEAFTPKNIRSHFQHVFIVVRVENPNTDHTTYKVAVSRSQDVPQFGPPIPPNSTFRNNKAFKDFLLSKIINAENAAHKSQKFTAMAVRTRFEYLKDLATNFVSATTIDSGGAKFSKFNPMSLSVKRREKIHPPCNPEVWCQGCLVWSVKVDLETATSGSVCFMGISTKVIVLIDKMSKEVLLAIPCKAVIGWRHVGNSMKLYYNNGQGLNICLVEEDANEITFVINRLKAVTPGCETQDMSLRRSQNGQLGFHVYYEGLVAEVEPYGMAWQAGLRKGSRLLEVSNRFVSKMSHDRMIQALKKPGTIRVVVLPPLPDGQPRNYKSTRNLKRYSSMTSVYSECVHNSSDSSPLSSSRENLDFDTVTPIRVGGNEITTVEARIKHSTPFTATKGSNQRPHGFILDSDQSLELTESSSLDQQFSVLNNQNGKNERKISLNSTSNRRVEIMGNKRLDNDSENYPKKSILDQKDSGKMVNKYGLKIPLGQRQSPSGSSLGSVDAELSELERTITDTRKSIDAKFYKSLVQNQVVRKNLDRSSKPDSGKIQNGDNRQEDGNQETQNRKRPSLHQRPSPPNFATLNLNVDKDGSKLVAEKSRPNENHSTEESGDTSKTSSMNRFKKPMVCSEEGSRRQAELQSSSSNSLNRMRSPPPYEEAITSLERRRKQKAKVTSNDKMASYRSDDRPLHTSSETDSNREDKPRYLSYTSERRYYRSMVKSENLEDLIGHARMKSEPHRKDSRNSSPDYKVEKARLTAALSESNIARTIERDGNIVQTRYRDVGDIIKEKSQIRAGSADHLAGFTSLLPRSRKSSIDTAKCDTAVEKTPKMPMEDSTTIETPKGEPYSKHPRVVNESVKEATDEEMKSNRQNDRMPYKETSLGPITTTTEVYSSADETLSDTFTKIDRAFGFTSYSQQAANSQPANKDERKRKKQKYRQRAKATKVCSDSSDDDNSNCSVGSNNVRRRNASGKSRDEDRWKPRPLSSDSLKKNKSEAEESLEAAITDFHSTLSSMPDQTSSLASSSDMLSGPPTPTPSDQGFSSAKTADEITQKVTTQYTNLSVSQKRDYPQTARATITYTDRGRYGLTNSSRQSSLDSPSHSGKEAGSRVQELVGKFSESSTRKGSLDSSTPQRGKPDRFRSRSEARISLLASPSPWVKREPAKSLVTEGNRDVRRLEKHRVSHVESKRNLFQQSDVIKQKISVTVTPKLSMDRTVDVAGPLPVLPNSPSWIEACERGKLSLPGRGKKTSRSVAENVFEMPLTVRGLDLAPQRAEELAASSKEDLRLMLSVLSGELVKEKCEKERLVEELQQAKIEKDQLLEQSQAAASQLRKFTSWFYDSVSTKDSEEHEGN